MFLGYNFHFHKLVVNVQNQVYFIFRYFCPKDSSCHTEPDEVATRIAAVLRVNTKV
jgi:hypothetical protein